MNRLLWTAGLVMVGTVLVAGTRPVFAQCELQRVVPGDAAADDEFGTSVAISGDYAIIGSPKDEPADAEGNPIEPTGAGSASLYKRDSNNVWNEVLPKLTASDAAVNDAFGTAVAIDGDYLVVGAPVADAAMGNADTGVAYVFQRVGEVWSQQAKLVASDAANGHQFGRAVAIRGDVIVVGARVAGVGGAVYVFRRSGDLWNQEGPPLVPADIFQGDQFGTSVATDGTVIAVGAPSKDVGTLGEAGGAYIFRHGDLGWVEEATLVGPVPAATNRLGAAVAVSGDVVLAGETNGDGVATNTGAVQLFRFDGTDSWSWEAELSASDGANLDQFGTALALQGDNVLVGASRDDNRTGAVYLFHPAGDAWIQVSKVLAVNPPDTRGAFGTALGLDGSFAVVGANALTANDQTGSAYIEVVDIALGIGGACVTCPNGDGDCVAPLSCTAGVCDQERGLCDFDVAAGTCLINGACKNAGETNPADDCQECNPAIAARGWSPKPNGSPCSDDNLFCSGVEVCQASNCMSQGDPCTALSLICDEAGNRCVECLISIDCNDSNDCTEDTCNDGSCQNLNLPVGATCGDPTATDCNFADTCNGQGVCLSNIQPNGTPCTDDGNSCTSDTCFATNCLHIPLPNSTPCTDDGTFCNGVERCLVGQCQSAGDPCSGQSCDEEANACVCDDNNDCNDSLSCTTDSCNLETGLCQNVVTAGSCLISGVCRADGAVNPANACEACAAALLNSNWSARPDGTGCASDGQPCTLDVCSAGVCSHPNAPDDTACGNGLFCDGVDDCQGGNCLAIGVDPCPDRGCDENRNQCICEDNADCEDGIACTINTCVTATGVCDPPVIEPGSCFIEGVCYANGAGNPADECEQCGAATDADGWSPKPNGTVCTDNELQTCDDKCTAGICAGSPCPTRWESIAVHGVVGDCGLEIPADGSFVEPRLAGVRKISVAYDYPITAAGSIARILGACDASHLPVDVSGIAVSTIQGGPDEVIITFTPQLPGSDLLPGAQTPTRYLVDLTGVGGGAADTSREFSVVLGDAFGTPLGTGDARVTAADNGLVRAFAASHVDPIDPSNAGHVRADVFTDGKIDAADSGLVRSLAAQQLSGHGLSLASCMPATCGDGIIGGPEECDDAGESATCDADCTFVVCGDGTLNATAGEHCDDGNTTAGDGCDASCRVEGGSVANDACADPGSVTDATISFSTAGATTDSIADSGPCPAAFDMLNDIWFCYLATCSGTATVSLCGSSYDTTLHVYSNCTCPTTDPLVCNDDGCGMSIDARASRITFAAVTGASYMIRIGGFEGATGTGSLTIYCGPDAGHGLDACGTNANDCEAANSTPACEDEDCCGEVCVLDPFCCDVQWDNVCGEEGTGICGGGFSACNADAGDCLTEHLDQSPGCNDVDLCQSICEDDPFCCLDSWDDICAETATTITGNLQACQTATSSCTAPNTTPGCSTEACCETVCLIDSYCCTDAWDRICVNLANDNQDVCSVPPGMVSVPAGSFQMGDTFNEGWSGELPVHTVYLDAFYMDKYEVTKGLWDTVRTWATSNGYDLIAAAGEGADHPVHNVNWYDCVKWCNARSQQEGRTPCYYTDAGLTAVYKTGEVAPYVNWAATGYRLPTEAEWEKAARGGTAGHRFPWSDTDTIQHARANYYSSSSYSYDTSPTSGCHPLWGAGSYAYTSPVGFFTGELQYKADWGWPGAATSYQTANGANGYGLHDMAGNVWEWCNDWYSGSYYLSSPGSNPPGPASGTYRVLRGGGWGFDPDSCRVANRLNDLSPGNRGYDFGFRCASGVP